MTLYMPDSLPAEISKLVSVGYPFWWSVALIPRNKFWAFDCTTYQKFQDIADVSHFVKPGTNLDKEAADRCTTVYLVGKRIDMIHSLLGTSKLNQNFISKFYCIILEFPQFVSITDLCSLRSNVDRLAFSCIWVGFTNNIVLILRLFSCFWYCKFVKGIKFRGWDCQREFRKKCNSFKSFIELWRGSKKDRWRVSYTQRSVFDLL